VAKMTEEEIFEMCQEWWVTNALEVGKQVFKQITPPPTLEQMETFRIAFQTSQAMMINPLSRLIALIVSRQ
jgi:hypothetical protein